MSTDFCVTITASEYRDLIEDSVLLDTITNLIANRLDTTYYIDIKAVAEILGLEPIGEEENE